VEGMRTFRAPTHTMSSVCTCRAESRGDAPTREHRHSSFVRARFVSERKSGGALNVSFPGICDHLAGSALGFSRGDEIPPPQVTALQAGPSALLQWLGMVVARRERGMGFLR